MSIKIGLLVTLMTLSCFSWAQKEEFNARDPRLNEGHLFAVKLTPKTKTLEVSLAGVPAAHLGPDRIEVWGRVLRDGKLRELTIKPSGEDFKIVEALDARTPIEVDIRDKKNQKKETFKFNLNEQP